MTVQSSGPVTITEEGELVTVAGGVSFDMPVTVDGGTITSGERVFGGSGFSAPALVVLNGGTVKLDSYTGVSSGGLRVTGAGSSYTAGSGDASPDTLFSVPDTNQVIVEAGASMTVEKWYQNNTATGVVTGEGSNSSPPAPRRSWAALSSFPAPRAASFPIH